MRGAVAKQVKLRGELIDFTQYILTQGSAYIVCPKHIDSGV